MPTIAEIEKNTSEWSKQYTQDGRLVYINKKTGKKVSRKPSVEERALEIALRNREGQGTPTPPDGSHTDHDSTHGPGTMNTQENIYVQQYTIDRTPFYMHLYSGEVMWFLPRGTPQTAVKYVTHVTESGVPYYENTEKKTTAWTLPLEKMTSLARKNASTYRKYSRQQVEEKLHISYEEARKESYLASSSKRPPSSAAKHGTETSSPETDNFMKKSKKSPEKKTPSKYHNIASKDFNNVMLTEKNAAANSEANRTEGIFGSGQERGKPLVRIVFERYDRNKDGFIDSRELQDLCYDFGSFLHESELRSAIERFDTSDTGSLNYIDFIVWWRNTETFSDLKITDGDVRQRSAAAEIFKRYDDQRVGYITRHQFRPLHAELVAAGLTSLNLEKCMSDLDANLDGIIQFNEFITWLDKSRKEWEGSSKNVARKLSAFKSSGPTLKKLFGDLMTSPNEAAEEEPTTIMAKDHPDYAKYFRMIAVGGDVRDVMPEMKAAGLDPSLLQTPHLIVPIAHVGGGSPDVKKEENFTNMFKKSKKAELELEPPPAPVAEASSNPFTFDPASYIYTSISKPLGISLGENVPECAMGVYVENCAPGGKAEATGLLYPGLVLISACGVDVQAYDFDSVMDILRNAPSDEPVDLVFADPTTAILNEAPLTESSEYNEVAEGDRNESFDDEVPPPAPRPGITALDSFVSAGGDDPFAEDDERRDTADDSFAELLERQREEQEQGQAAADRRPFSSKTAAAAVLKATARRKLEAQASAVELDLESSPVVTGKKSLPPAGGVFGMPTDAESLFKQPEPEPQPQQHPFTPTAEDSDRPPTVTRVSSLRRGRNNLKEALRLESGDGLLAIPTSFSSAEKAAAARSEPDSGTLDASRILGRAKAPPKRLPSDIPAGKEDFVSPVKSPSRPAVRDYPAVPPPPKPSLDILEDDDDSPPSPPVKTTANPMFMPRGVRPVEPSSPMKKPASPAAAAQKPPRSPSMPSAVSPLTMSGRPKPPPPLYTPETEQDDDLSDHEVYVPASRTVVIDEHSSFNPVAKKPMSVFNYSAGAAAPSPMIDPYLRDRYGGVPLTPPQGLDNEEDDDFPDVPINVDSVSTGCQTDYSAYMDAEYHTSYQMLLGEKAEVQNILARVRAEELAANARIQRAEDDSFRRCEERELYLSEMLAVEEQRAMERIAEAEEKMVAQQAELKAAWDRLREAEMAAKQFHNSKMNDLINVASSLALHHKKIIDDKRKVGKQRLSLDLAMRDINNYTHFSPFGQDSSGYSPGARGGYSAPNTPMAAPRQYPASEGRPVSQRGAPLPAYYSQQQPMQVQMQQQRPPPTQASRNHIPGQGRTAGRPSPASGRIADSTPRSKSASRSRQIDYRNL